MAQEEGHPMALDRDPPTEGSLDVAGDKANRRYKNALPDNVTGETGTTNSHWTAASNTLGYIGIVKESL